MGKNWRRHGDRNREAGRDNRPQHEDLNSIRGLGCIIATCDAAREKEANKELVNLVTQAIERLYPDIENTPATGGGAEESSSSTGTKSMAELLQEVRSMTHVNINEVYNCINKLKCIILFTGTSASPYAEQSDETSCHVY